MALSLQTENDQLEQDIQRLQQKLSEMITQDRHIEPDTSQTETSGTLHVDILRKKCKDLQAQIDHIEDRKYNVLSDDKTIQFNLLMEGLQKSISKTKEILKFQEHLKNETLEKTEREKKVNDELSSVVDAAQAKCRQIQTEKTSKELTPKPDAAQAKCRQIEKEKNIKGVINDTHPKNALANIEENGILIVSDKMVCDRLKVKCKKIETINRKLKKEMSEFIRQNFPTPDVKQFNSVKKKVNMNKDGIVLTDHASLLSLMEVIEILMSANADNPNDSYVELDHRFWPPFIDLLLEVDLIVRHPTHPGRRIKLTPFHL